MWFRIDDMLPQSVKVRGLAATLAAAVRPLAPRDRAKRDRNSAVGAWVQLCAWSSGERTDGFLPADVVEDYATPEDIARLTRSTLGRAPMLHAAGEKCRCLDERAWPAGAGYLVHDFLDRNPSRAENDVARAQRRELRDRELRAAVRKRDQDRCRYCGVAVSWQDRRSALGGVLEHVRPDIAGGVDNLVVACRGCNSRKGKRTPEAAGMMLRPVPGTTSPIYDGSTTDQTRTTETGVDRIQNGPLYGTETALDHPHPSPDPRAGSFGPHAGSQRAQNTIYNEDPEPTSGTRTDAPGRGRDGTPPVVDRPNWATLDLEIVRGPVAPPRPRSAGDGNPYLRSAITGPSPDEHAGLIPDPEEVTR